MCVFFLLPSSDCFDTENKIGKMVVPYYNIHCPENLRRMKGNPALHVG